MRGILSGESRALAAVGLAAVALWAVLALPLATGERTLVLRDVMTSHLPLKTFGAAELEGGRIPALQPHWGGGQPYRGSPNGLPFYPGNLLFVALPFWSAFGLHYALHWLVAALGMARLARELGQGRAGALVAALAYGGSGYVLSALTFMNLLTVAAWAPWALAGLARGGRRGTLLAGVATGLMLLGGEPLAAAMVAPFLLGVALSRERSRRGLGAALLAGAIGLLVAAPQLVATLRVLPASDRVAHGIASDQVTVQSLHPARLLELVLPLPWGWPSDLGRFGFWSSVVTPHVPYVYSLHFGVVAFALALVAARHRRGWAAAAAGSLAGAWALGLDAELTRALTFGAFRYPQKLIFPFTLAAAVLAGFGAERALVRARPARVWLAGAAACALAAALVAARFEAFARWLAAQLASERSLILARTQAGHWMVLAAAAALVLALAGWAAARRSAAGLAAAQLLALLGLAPLWLTDRTAPYREPAALAAAVAAPRTVLQVAATVPPWETPARFPRAAIDPVVQTRLGRAWLEPSYGLLDGLSHPLAPDLDGLGSPLSAFVARNLALADWTVRLRWIRRLGIGWTVRTARTPVEGLTPVASDERFGVVATLARVERPFDEVSWPRAIALAANPIDAWLRVARGEVADDVAVASRALDHHADGRIVKLTESADRVVLEVDSAGGLAVLRRAYQPLYEARLEDGTPVATQPADLALLGLELPPGRHRVTVEVTSGREWTAALVALATLAAVAVLVWRGR